MLDPNIQGKLARFIKPGPYDPDLDRFAAFVERGAIISGVRWYCVEAEEGETEMRFKPEGGLTDDHYRRLGTNPLDRAQLARAVIENLLKRRGHGHHAVEEAFRGVIDDNLPGLVDEYSFEAMADALEDTIRSPRLPSNTGLGEGTPDTSLVVCQGPTRSRDGRLPPALLEILHRLKALETRVEEVDSKCRRLPESRNTPLRTFLQTEEAAAYLGITVKALYSLKDRGKLKSLTGSRKLRFTPKMLDDYLHGRK